MKTKWIVACLVTGLLAAGCATESAMLAKAKISKADAEKTAMAKVPNGTIKESELEDEDGKLVWSFDFATPGSKDITEIQIDAMTGAFIKMENESPEDQEKEKAEDKAKK